MFFIQNQTIVIKPKCLKAKKYQTLVDLGGVHPVHTPSYRSRFFHFDMQNFWNVAASGVHGPPYDIHAPPTGNPGSATAKHQIFTWKLANFHQNPYINETNINFTYNLDTRKNDLSAKPHVWYEKATRKVKDR